MWRKTRAVAAACSLLIAAETYVANAEESAPEDGIRDSIQKVVQAINTQDLELYATAVTDDLLNMTLYGEGEEVISTFGRRARLEELAGLFKNAGVNRHAAMTPTEIHVSGDWAYVHVDGVLTFTPQDENSPPGSRHKLDIYMFYWKDPDQGWQTERSMAVVRESTTL